MATPPAPPTPDQPRPFAWWHYLIVYPALVTSLIAAIPTVWTEVKAWRLGVAASQLQLVQEQQRLWERNADCIVQGSSYEIDGPEGITIRVTLCQTGDALIRYHLREWPTIFKWVALPVEKVQK